MYDSGTWTLSLYPDIGVYFLPIFSSLFYDNWQCQFILYGQVIPV
jgi:hypothetical protein